MIIRHSRSYGDFPKKISSHLVSLIKVEGLISPYIVTHFDIVKLRIVGLALRTVGPFIGRNKPIFLSLESRMKDLSDGVCHT